MIEKMQKKLLQDKCQKSLLTVYILSLISFALISGYFLNEYIEAGFLIIGCVFHYLRFTMQDEIDQWGVPMSAIPFFFVDMICLCSIVLCMYNISPIVIHVLDVFKIAGIILNLYVITSVFYGD